MSRTIVVILTSMALIGLVAAPAAATPPVHEDVVIDNVVEDDGDICGFPIRWTIRIEGRVSSFFDRDGTLVREQFFIQELNTIENLDTGLVLVEGPDAFMQRTTFEPDGTPILTSTGLSVFVSAGRDSVIDAGRFVISVSADGVFTVLFSAGQHDPRQRAADADGLEGVLGSFCDVLS